MQKEGKKTKTLPVNSEREAPRGLHIEIDKVQSGLAVCINGVSSVLDFGEECAVLKLRRGKVIVSGSCLSISLYENKIAEISGKVDKIEFL